MAAILEVAVGAGGSDDDGGLGEVDLEGMAPGIGHFALGVAVLEAIGDDEDFLVGIALAAEGIGDIDLSAVGEGPDELAIILEGADEGVRFLEEGEGFRVAAVGDHLESGPAQESQDEENDDEGGGSSHGEGLGVWVGEGEVG